MHDPIASNFPLGTSTVVVVVDVVDALSRKRAPVVSTPSEGSLSSRKIEDDFQFSSVIFPVFNRSWICFQRNSVLPLNLRNSADFDIHYRLLKKVSTVISFTRG